MIPFKVIFWIVVVVFPSASLALDAVAPPVLGPGGVRVRLMTGLAVLDRDPAFAGDLSLEVGVAEGVELIAPLAVGIRVLETEPGSGLYLTLGLTDFFVARSGDVYYTPALAFTGQARLGHESTVRGGLDVVGVEQGLARGSHPFWLRGSLAFIIEFGPWLTFAAGVSYERQISAGAVSDNLEVTGWVGDSRISMGAVRSQSFAELPTLSVHVLPFLDLIALVSFDIDMNTRSSNSWWLVGVELKSYRREVSESLAD